MFEKKKSKANTFIVAEVSANHGQSLKRAIKMIREAKRCGADAVKFQAYTADTITLNSSKKYFRIKHTKWKGQTLYQLYQKACTPWSWFKNLKHVADEEGIDFFSTAFDRTAVDFLEELNVPMHKIASFELIDLPLIEYAAKTKKPLIMSTGMATLGEIREAVAAAKSGGAREIALLKCVSTYPADPGEMNLKTIPDMKRRFKCKAGLSDHTLGIGVAVAAACLGADMIEKHFTLSRKIKTPDSFFSTEPGEFKSLVENVRIAKEAMGGCHYGITEREKKNRIFRRSIFAIKDIRSGEAFTALNVKSIRPAYGLAPKYLSKIMGKKAKKDIKKGVPLAREDVKW